MAGGLFANAKVRLIASALAGAVLGIVIGWCTNAAMVEISINAIFALYFGKWLRTPTKAVYGDKRRSCLTCLL